MLRENEDSYVQSYIQTQSIGIACEALTLQQLEHEENGGQRTTTKGGNYSNAVLSINPRGPVLRSMTSHCMNIRTANLVRPTWFKGD